MTIRNFDDTGEAYDSCQCDESIKTGDTLVIKGGEFYGNRRYNLDGEFDRMEFDPPKSIGPIVGLAWAWPIAVTVEAGHLHKLGGKPGALDRIKADAPFSDEQIAMAVAKARQLGAKVAPEFEAY